MPSPTLSEDTAHAPFSWDLQEVAKSNVSLDQGTGQGMVWRGEPRLIVARERDMPLFMIAAIAAS